MNFVALMSAIALWCGQPTSNSGPYGKPSYYLGDVQKCRDKMIECVQADKIEELALSFDTVSACFQSMSFGEMRPLKIKGKKK